MTDLITFPLPFERVIDFTKDEKPLVVVDYKNGKYQGDAFFNYASNLGIPTNIHPGNLTYDEKTVLLVQYMHHRCVGTFPSLNAEIADCLLGTVGSTRRLSDEPFLTEEERVVFIKSHLPHLAVWVSFLTSLVVFALDCHVRGLNNEKANSSTGATTPALNIKTFPVVDDPNVIGANIVNLFSIPAFMEWFMEKAYEEPVLFYFKHQFNERCFGGKSLYDYVAQPQHAFFIAMLSSVQTNLKD